MQISIPSPPPTSAPLCATRLEMVEAGARLATILGIPRSTGQIYGLLYLAYAPMSLDEIADKLTISKASASTGTRQLASFGAIRQVWLQGDRRDHYEVIADLANLLRSVLDGFVKPRLKSSDRRVSQLTSTLDRDLADGHVTPEEHRLIKTRLENLSRVQTRIDRWLPLAEKLF